MTPLLAQAPALEKRADLIQTIDSIVNMLAFIVNLILGYLLWLTRKEQDKRRDDELSPLRTITWQTLRDRSPLGAPIQWIDRGATDANELRAQPRVALIGLSGEGKSREASELIRRAVELDLVAETKVFEPNRMAYVARYRSLRFTTRGQSNVAGGRCKDSITHPSRQFVCSRGGCQYSRKSRASARFSTTNHRSTKRHV